MPSLQLVTAATSVQENLPPPVARLIDAAHDQFAQFLGTNLSALLRASMTVETGRMESMLFDALRARMVRPSCIVAVRTRPANHAMLLMLAPVIVFPALELLLGGKHEPQEPAARPLTDLEWHVLEEIVRVIARGLGEAWQPFGTMEFDVASLNSDPGLIDDFEQTDAILSIPFTVTIGSHSGVLEIIVPASFFAISAEAPVPAPVNGRDQARILELISEAAVDLEVILPGQDATLRELSELQPGNVLTFEHGLNVPLTGVVNGESILLGQIAPVGKKRGFTVQQIGATVG